LIDVAVPTKIETVASSDTYARYVVEPLESGYGVTLGNAMRRVLLSSLPGAAITSIRIEGIYHEFSSIPHVKEDITTILLNVKSIRLRWLASSDNPVRLYIQAQGEGVITAGDIEAPSGIEIVNKEQPLITLSSPDARLVVEMVAERGRGYVPAEMREGLPIGTIPVDSIFSPVRKVNFVAEHTRIGQVTTYDRLVLEIWSDGTMHPDEALNRSAEILVRHFSLMANLEHGPQRVEKQPLGVSTVPARLYEVPIEDLELSVRAFNCLKRAGITKVGQVLEMSETELLTVRNFGQKSLDELRQRLVARGYIVAPAAADAQRAAGQDEQTEPEDNDSDEATTEENAS
jgi:DNA-directed RNA polymerase subunit alpha